MNTQPPDSDVNARSRTKRSYTKTDSVFALLAVLVLALLFALTSTAQAQLDGGTLAAIGSTPEAIGAAAFANALASARRA